MPINQATFGGGESTSRYGAAGKRASIDAIQDVRSGKDGESIVISTKSIRLGNETRCGSDAGSGGAEWHLPFSQLDR
jgi:hypothetical protein